MGRLQWLALLCLRSRFLRPRFAMVPPRYYPWAVKIARSSVASSVSRRLTASRIRCCGSIGDMAEDVRAEIVASVLEVVVSKGDQIGAGEILVLLESMKMEIPVLAEVAGIISVVNVAVGDVIQAGHLIAVID